MPNSKQIMNIRIPYTDSPIAAGILYVLLLSWLPGLILGSLISPAIFISAIFLWGFINQIKNNSNLWDSWEEYAKLNNIPEHHITSIRVAKSIPNKLSKHYSVYASFSLRDLELLKEGHNV